jgi:spore maturation protein CgeB
MNKLFLETVKNNDFDLVLLSKTDTVDYDLIPEINKYTRTWYYFMDPMDQAIRINAAAYAKNATWASATFSDVTEYFKNKGANAYWITQGVDTDIFKPRQAIKVYDVVFAGTRTARRFQYVNILRKNGIAVKCFGEGWENNPIYNEELVDIYRKSKIVLNFCREGCGFSIRVFQVMGTGTFIMSEYCNDLEHFFQRGKHLDWFKDSVELEEKILFYLSHGEEREKIAKGGCNFVLSQHSWNEVMKEVIRIVETS